MSTKQTLNAVTEGASGSPSITSPDGSAVDTTDPNAVIIYRTRPCGAQRFKNYNPINPPVTP
jgi:hypothetical protein